MIAWYMGHRPGEKTMLLTSQPLHSSCRSGIHLSSSSTQLSTTTGEARYNLSFSLYNTYTASRFLLFPLTTTHPEADCGNLAPHLLTCTAFAISVVTAAVHTQSLMTCQAARSVHAVRHHNGSPVTQKQPDVTCLQ